MILHGPIRVNNNELTICVFDLGLVRLALNLCGLSEIG
jgi:hypothetical protein